MKIAPRLRVALAAKGALLGVLLAVFVALLYRGAISGDHAWWVRTLSAIVFAPISMFLGQTTWLAFADAALGNAVIVHGAVALASRRSGLSFKLPDGHFAEFILFNPWPKAIAHQRYTLTLGQRSRVVVAPPEPEPAPSVAAPTT